MLTQLPRRPTISRLVTMWAQHYFLEVLSHFTKTMDRSGYHGNAPWVFTSKSEAQMGHRHDGSKSYEPWAHIGDLWAGPSAGLY